MVPTDDAMITRQMLYSARPFPAPCATLAISPPPQSEPRRPTHLESQSKSARRFYTFPINSVANHLMQQNQTMWRRTPSSVQAWAKLRAPRHNSLPTTDHPNPASPPKTKSVPLGTPQTSLPTTQAPAPRRAIPASYANDGTD